ncbi:MAG TPA: hypothetical protein VNZ86_10815 [Bacteroidia bacterium]|jgi:hypothetical protein|nr:hypothetical protein [Bacteroidia bacterium]
MITAFRTSSLILLLSLFLLSGNSCKKEASVTYSMVSVNICLVEYNFGIYAPGTWSTQTRIKIRYGGQYLDSLMNLYGAYNLPQNTALTNPCSTHLNVLSHVFRIQNNVLNTLEISDPNGLRISYQLNNSTAYFNVVSDSTTSYCPNTGCPLSIFAIR